ncbi:hypothetical protein N7460_007023 [Penicillium canescens]|uniref:DUF7730 domain-containing protein n=1 Tax=Penicillium canescens TaxID=5083 RepID=A0AAD6IBK8_PENCN|nr:hypothetical protein N7460_007023 [Penicillium canescens]
MLRRDKQMSEYQALRDYPHLSRDYEGKGEPKIMAFNFTKSKENHPRRLPRRRRRTISPPPIRPQKRKRNMTESLSQSSCPSESFLLTRLPRGVRQLVWEAALGGLRLHIIQRHKRRLGHIVCPQLDSCVICNEKVAQPVKGDIAQVTGSLIALPMVCRQMYRETIDVLYGRNTFEFSNAWTLSYLQSTILRHRWDNIRQIEIRWRPPSGRVQDSKAGVISYYKAADQIVWKDTCRIIKDMGGLKHFRLQVCGLDVLSTKWSEFLGPPGHLDMNGTWETHLQRASWRGSFLL